MLKGLHCSHPGDDDGVDDYDEDDDDDDNEDGDDNGGSGDHLSNGLRTRRFFMKLIPFCEM